MTKINDETCFSLLSLSLLNLASAAFVEVVIIIFDSHASIPNLQLSINSFHKQHLHISLFFYSLGSSKRCLAALFRLDFILFLPSC